MSKNRRTGGAQDDSEEFVRGDSPGHEKPAAPAPAVEEDDDTKASVPDLATKPKPAGLAGLTGPEVAASYVRLLPVNRMSRLEALARTNRDVRWLLDEHRRLAKKP